MAGISTFLRSPLARHPSLLARKIGSRLGVYSHDVGMPSNPGGYVSYPRHWTDALQNWLRSVPFNSPPHPFHRVFQQNFEEPKLLGLCRHEPTLPGTGLVTDIKLIWDYSRGQPLVTNAAAAPGQLDLSVGFLRRWLEVSKDINGPLWTCAMEISIRAINWIFADILYRGRLGETLGSTTWAEWLWCHAFLIWRRLETRIICSNHYLADLLGLFVVGSVFPEVHQARNWVHFAKAEFPRALVAQTRSDGGLYEASLRYHAYVTEMALLFRLAQGTPFPEHAETRLRQMCQIVADFSDATGDVFAIGDDDSGRVLALDYASTKGRAEILLHLAKSVLGLEFSPAANRLCSESGWFVARADDFVVALDFGGVGLGGIGGHAHNDDFSFCLDWRGQALVVDPGTCFYTGDPVARNRFRSVRYHNTLIVDEREPRELSENVFSLPGSDAPFLCRTMGSKGWAFTREILPGIIHRREVAFSERGLCVRDFVEGSGRHHLQFKFHLHPAVEARINNGVFELTAADGNLLALKGAVQSGDLEIIDAEYSATYGQSEPSKACLFRGYFDLPFSVEWNFVAQG